MKVQVNLNDDFVKELDEFAAKMGVSRSSLCAVWLGQQMEAVRISQNIINQLSGSVAAELPNLLISKDGESID